LVSITVLLQVISHNSKPNPYAKLGTTKVLTVNTLFEYRKMNNQYVQIFVGNV